MEIATRCKENTIDNFVSNIDDITILFDQLSPAIQEFFQHGFIETERTERVKNCNWILRRQLEVFPGQSSIITEDFANELLALRHTKRGLSKTKIQNR